MISKIDSFIQQHQLFRRGTPILVACSGGVDSMVLVDMLHQLNYSLVIAHCNFQLRADASDSDEDFIKQYAALKGIPFFSVRFDTKDYKEKNSLSTQMAARALRYDWFEKIRREVGASVIATAHHLNDQVETVLLNLTRGTGLKGLSGISPKNEKVVRPLLEITKAELLEYADQHKINYREDSSNASDDYQRNLLRHHVVEVLKKINPSLENTFGDFVGFMDDYNILLKEQLDTIKKQCTSEKNGIFEIKFGFIKRHLAGRTILFHILSEFSFNAAQCTLIFDSFKIAANTGQQFFSTTHRLVVDRRSMFVIRKDIERENYLKLDKIPHQIVFNNYKIQCTVVPVHEVNIKTSPRYAYVDLDALVFPLMLRYYKEGDYFYPFGMSKPKTPGKVGKKKVSKFFKDEKIPQFDKENTAMLFSGDRLVWLLGHRIDDRFKVTPKTKHVLKLVLVDDEVGA